MADIIVPGSGRSGPQVPYGIGNALAGRFAGAVGAGGGYGLAAQRLKLAARKPGLGPLPVPAGLEGLTQTQQGYGGPGDFLTRITRGRYGALATYSGDAVPSNQYDVQGALTGVDQTHPFAGNFGYHSTMDIPRLTAMATAMRNYSTQMPQSLGAFAPGFGDSGPALSLRKLIQQKMGVGY